MSYITLTFSPLHALFLLFLQCGGESSNANVRCDNESGDHHTSDQDIASDRPQSPAIEAARENIVEEGVAEKVRFFCVFFCLSTELQFYSYT